MRHAWKAMLVLAVLLAGAALPVLASVPKVILCDEFGYIT